MSQRWRGGGASQRARPARPRKPCANPIFESWIEEWKEEADAKDSKMKFVYAKALQSLRKYPLPLSSGKECSILENFGSHMCKMIENRMVKENMIPDVGTSESAQGLQGVIDLPDEAPKPSKKAAKATKAGEGKQGGTSSKKKAVEVVDVDMGDPEEEFEPPPVMTKPKPKGKRQYVPAFRSGAYALLMAFYKKEQEADYRGYMTKSELLHKAQNYCNSSDANPAGQQNQQSAPALAIRGLVDKELIIKQGNPLQFFLTPDGRALAQKLAGAESDGVPIPQQNSEEVDSDCEVSSQDDENEMAFLAKEVRMEAGTFEIVLYVDTCETSGKSKSQEVLNELQKNGVTVYVNRLSVGDFVWVCKETAVATGSTGSRNRLTLSSATQELVLPYVVERKRADDLAHSIRDGRYKEQKYRLTQTKLRVVYLIESYGKGDWGLAEGALGQAMCNTQVQGGFHVQETSSIKDTCAYLTFMTRHLKDLYENKTLIGRQKTDYCVDDKPDNPNEEYVMFFSDFNDFAVKKTHWNVKEMFARHLMRMKGLSVDKAFAIVQKYPTLHDLMKAYDECTTDKQREQLLSAIHFGNGDRKIGPSISRKVAYLYNNSNLF